MPLGINILPKGVVIMKINLRILLAERKLKMTDVIRDTGLSKTAVRGIFHETSKGIQFDTLESLCEYLNCGVEELLILERKKDVLMKNGTKVDIEIEDNSISEVGSFLEILKMAEINLEELKSFLMLDRYPITKVELEKVTEYLRAIRIIEGNNNR